MSEREAAQIKWSRCVNTSGRQGCNIPMDLHMEHLNRRLKSILCSMGSNVTDNSVTLGAKSTGIVQYICQTFLTESGAGEISGHHSIPSFKADFNLI